MLSLVPSTPAAPLVAGLKLFHPRDTAEWLGRWAEERPGDGDPLAMLMAPATDTFKRCGPRPYSDVASMPAPSSRLLSLHPVCADSR